MPTTFAEVVAHVITLVLADFDREIGTKQLRYHTREHINGVQQRASRIFEVVRVEEAFGYLESQHRAKHDQSSEFA